MDVPLVAELGRAKVKLKGGKETAGRWYRPLADPDRGSGDDISGRQAQTAGLALWQKKKRGELQLKVMGEVPADSQDRYGVFEVSPEAVWQPARCISSRNKAASYSAVSSKITTLWWGFMRLDVTELDYAIGGMEYLARLALKSSESSFEMCCYGRM